MSIALGQGLWAVVLPVTETNIATNPSFEKDAAGVVAIQAATLGTTSQFQRYGAWSLKVTPSSNGTSGAILGTWSSGIGTTYSVSVWAFVEQGVPMRMAVGDGNGLNLTSGSVTFTGGGTWQWYNTGIIETSAVNRSVVLQKTSGVSQLSFYADGVKISPWTDSQDRVTTYLDGDQPGCQWLGPAHASQSQRSGQYRSGGTIMALVDLGLSVDQMIGAGVPPIEMSTQSYAITPGAQFQFQRASQRKFNLTAKPISGTSLADFHATRRTIYDAFKPDLVSTQQPIRFLYYGAQGTQQIDAYYDRGLELGNMIGPIAEDMAISFIATDPYWYAPTQEGTALSPRTNLGSVRFIASRDPYGRWGTMGPNGSSIDGAPNAITIGADGLVYVGGNFGSAAGTRARFVATWNPRGGVWGTLPTGTLNAQINDILLYPTGDLYFGGNFTSAAGTTANSIVKYNPTLAQYGTLGGGGGVGAVQSILALTLGQNGLLYMGGSFQSVAGTTTNNIAQYNPFSDRFGTMLIGIQNSAITPVSDLLTALDGKIYIGGNFGSAGGGTAANIAYWNPSSVSYGTLSTGLQAGGVAGNTFVNRLAQGPSGVLYVGGNFGSAGGGTAAYLAQWNGIAWLPVGLGSFNGQVSTLLSKPSGDLIIGGAFSSAGGLGTIPARVVDFNGASFLSFDLDADYPVNGADMSAMCLAPDGTTYFGITGGGGSAMAASVAQIVNHGRAEAYPLLRARAPASGTAQLYQFVNTLTNDGIYFRQCVLQPGEEVKLDLKARSFTSSMRGNMFNTIAPGSNLATFRLLSGTNYISFFSDTDALSVSLTWQPVGWSIDSGTVL